MLRVAATRRQSSSYQERPSCNPTPMAVRQLREAGSSHQFNPTQYGFTTASILVGR
jgi:hypothetical protein